MTRHEAMAAIERVIVAYKWSVPGPDHEKPEEESKERDYSASISTLEKYSIEDGREIGELKRTISSLLVRLEAVEKRLETQSRLFPVTSLVSEEPVPPSTSSAAPTVQDLDSRLDVLCYHSEFLRHLLKKDVMSDEAFEQAFHRMKFQFQITCEAIEVYQTNKRLSNHKQVTQ